MQDQFVVRQMHKEERPAVIELVNTSFSFGQNKNRDFLRDYPYVWNDDRISNSWICLLDDKIISLVGVYPFEIRMAGVDFRTAFIGQVATLPEYRGQGIMSRIFQTVLEHLDSGQYDFAGLSGNRQRYNRFGWAPGGQKYVFETTLDCLPLPPDESEIRQLESREDVEKLWKHMQSLPYSVHYTRHELQQFLNIPVVITAAYRDARVVCFKESGSFNVVVADGSEDNVAAIMAYLLHKANAEDPNITRIYLSAGPYDYLLSRVALRYYLTMKQNIAASFRICDMKSYFEKAARIATPSLPGGTDEISFRNTDNGQEVRLACENRKITVEPAAGQNVREMTTTEISRTVFSMLPLDLALGGIKPNSPIRTLLRIPAYIPFLW